MFSYDIDVLWMAKVPQREISDFTLPKRGSMVIVLIDKLIRLITIVWLIILIILHRYFPYWTIERTLRIEDINLDILGMI